MATYDIVDNTDDAVFTDTAARRHHVEVTDGITGQSASPLVRPRLFGFRNRVSAGSLRGAVSVVPGQPTALTAFAHDESAEVIWTPPINIGSSAILSYTATASPGGAQKTVNYTERVAVVTGLTNGQAYTLTVVATNAAGASVDSSASNSVTPNP